MLIRYITFLFLFLVSTPCTVAAQEIRSCYSGRIGSASTGICHAGTQEFTTTGWTPCEEEVLPRTEVYDNMIDEDCNGILSTSVACEEPDNDRLTAINAVLIIGLVMLALAVIYWQKRK